MSRALRLALMASAAIPTPFRVPPHAGVHLVRRPTDVRSDARGLMTVTYNPNARPPRASDWLDIMPPLALVARMVTGEVTERNIVEAVSKELGVSRETRRLLAT